MKRYLPFIIIIVVLVAAVVIFSLTLRKENSGSDAKPDLVNTNQTTQVAGNSGTATPATANPATPNPAELTKPNIKISSPVVVEEYGDYQCPPCGLLYPELKTVEKEYGNQIQIVFHHFPLTRIHKNAMAAAHAAEAARNQNKWLEMHDRLYRNQKEWADLDDARPVFLAYARQLNLNVEQFTQDMQSNQVDQRIGADIQRGAAAGVNGTPTIFIDGLMLKAEATNPEGLRRGINAMMMKKAVN